MMANAIGSAEQAWLYNEDLAESLPADLPDLPDDVFIATYPKCGTTWTQEITYLIYNDGVPPKNHLERIRNNPFIEMLGEDGPKNMGRPGCIKTHLPRDLVPYADHAKYIYVLRNPKGRATLFLH